MLLVIGMLIDQNAQNVAFMPDLMSTNLEINVSSRMNMKKTTGSQGLLMPFSLLHSANWLHAVEQIVKRDPSAKVVFIELV